MCCALFLFYFLSHSSLCDDVDVMKCEVENDLHVAASIHSRKTLMMMNKAKRVMMII